MLVGAVLLAWLATRIFPPIERSLHEAKPDGVELNSDMAWRFLSEAAPLLTEAGMSVIVPSELTRTGQRRMRMRMRIGTRSSGGSIAFAEDDTPRKSAGTPHTP